MDFITKKGEARRKRYLDDYEFIINEWTPMAALADNLNEDDLYDQLDEFDCDTCKGVFDSESLTKKKLETRWTEYYSKMLRKSLFGYPIWNGTGPLKYFVLKPPLSSSPRNAYLLDPPITVWDIDYRKWRLEPQPELDLFMRSLRRHVKLTRGSTALMRRHRKDDLKHFPNHKIHHKVEIALRQMVDQLFEDVAMKKENPKKSPNFSEVTSLDYTAALLTDYVR